MLMKWHSLYQESDRLRFKSREVLCTQFRIGLPVAVSDSMNELFGEVEDFLFRHDSFVVFFVLSRKAVLVNVEGGAVQS